MERTRVAIVGGGGGVGASVAFNLLRRAEPYDLTLVDVARHMAVSHELDLQQVVAQGSSGSVAVGELDAIWDADVVVVTAAAPLTVNQSRNVYLRDNAALLGPIADELRGWDGVLLLVTNPVDPLVTWLVRERGLRRVLGYTLNDSLRLRTGLADALGVTVGRVEAWMIGEHGDGAVALWDRVRVDGALVEVEPAAREAARAFVRDWYVTHVALDSGRSSTWTSGLGVARMIAAIAHGSDSAWPASVVLHGEYGLRDVAVSVPVALPSGRALEWALTPDQRDALHAAAREIAAAL
jgi:malate dehydrogenase